MLSSHQEGALFPGSDLPILPFTRSQVFVIRKLSSMYSIIRSNFFIGMAMVRVSSGTQGRAEGSNIPRTARGSSDCCSSRG